MNYLISACARVAKKGVVANLSPKAKSFKLEKNLGFITPFI